MSHLVAPNNFQIAYEGEIWCLFTVVFREKADFAIVAHTKYTVRNSSY